MKDYSFEKFSATWEHNVNIGPAWEEVPCNCSDLPGVSSSCQVVYRSEI